MYSISFIELSRHSLGFKRTQGITNYKVLLSYWRVSDCSFPGL